MTTEQFITELRKQAKMCKFDELNDDLIKLMLICGTRNQEVRHRLLEEDNINLEKAIKLAAVIEESKMQVKSMHHPTGEATSSVDRVTSNPRTDQVAKVPTRWSRTRSKTPQRYRHRSKSQGRRQHMITNCNRCGLSHEINKCPAYNKICNKCKTLNHFANVCKAPKQVNIVNENDDENEVIYISCVKNSFKTTNNLSWTTNLKINDKTVSFKLDTGAMANIISIKIFDELSIPVAQIIPTKTILKSYTGNVLPILGKCQLKCEYNNENYTVEFYVVSNTAESLLGLRTCIDLNIVSKNEPEIPINKVTNHNSSDITEWFGDVFSGIGCINPPYNIKLENNAVPVITPIRKVPFALLDKLKETLKSLEKLQII